MTADQCGHGGDGEAGSASLWALSMAMVLWVCVAGVVLAGVAVIARHRAATAADMAALAAATAIERSELPSDPASEPTACAAANAIAVANDATVTSCQVTAQAVDVTARVSIPAFGVLRVFGLDSVSARARAGPG